MADFKITREYIVIRTSPRRFQVAFRLNFNGRPHRSYSLYSCKFTTAYGAEDRIATYKARDVKEDFENMERAEKDSERRGEALHRMRVAQREYARHSERKG